MATPDRDSLANGLVSIADEGRLVEEWVQTGTYDFLRQLGAFGN